jgi:hypothetical protein
VQSGQKQVCPSCGVTLTVPGPRCPSCGFLLASAPGPVFQNSIRPKRARPAGNPSSSLPTILAGVGLAAIVVSATTAFWLLRRQDDTAALAPLAAASVSAAPSTVSSSGPDAGALFGQAKAKALAWHQDAALVQIDLAPVVDGKLDADATLEFVFGKPVIGKGIGPGTAVQSSLFVVTADARGLRESERPGSNASAVAEPNCIFEEALEKAAKSGVALRDRLRLRYAQSQKSGRGLWFVSRDGDAEPLRTLDGANCAIIVTSSAPTAAKK